MARKGISILKGIEANEIIALLNKAYADEWLAYYQYFIEAKVVKGIMKDGVVAELNQHAADELRHATMVADRILQLGGEPLLHPKDWFIHANCAYEAPTNPNVLNVLEQAIKGEQCAIEVYSRLAEITQGKDIVTYDIVSQILADEVEHEEDLQGLYEDIQEFIHNIKGEIQ
ncbi:MULTISPECIES: ferritin-like domain-containing protein [unclassified Nitratiruptor]|uniref:ferritin-like domain-containing protein n=1 Tax=unclassified Nitratiruptor TaxID=2624044 RepID=UPI0001587061|nr:MULTISPECIES: ferritin-like domain-containing protein [unclassified Nitratiruptor]BAF70260.1 bacterioferritin [Nitratiruptor sp. SB155-2]BCD60126.1 bacterioferritin [Nitratiruptor sp. YY08-10]BCD64385.1 bacterioferritin [Nitratiruptor sp. YY08-14]